MPSGSHALWIGSNEAVSAWAALGPRASELDRTDYPGHRRTAIPEVGCAGRRQLDPSKLAFNDELMTVRPAACCQFGDTQSNAPDESQPPLRA